MKARRHGRDARARGLVFEALDDEIDGVFDGEVFEAAEVEGDEGVAEAHVDELPGGHDGVDVFAEDAAVLAFFDHADEEFFELVVVVLDDGEDFFIAAGGEGAVEDVVGVFHALDVGGEFDGDGADLFGGVVDVTDNGLPLAEGVFGHLAGDGNEEILLGLEMAVEDGFGDAGSFGNGGGGGGGVAAARKELGGGVDELAPALGSLESGHGKLLTDNLGICNVDKAAMRLPHQSEIAIIVLMTIQELDLHHKQRPFEPFRLLTADGRFYDVRHPERLASLRAGRMISVATDQGFVILDLLLVIGLEKPIPKHKSRAKRAS